MRDRQAVLVGPGGALPEEERLHEGRDAVAAGFEDDDADRLLVDETADHVLREAALRRLHHEGDGSHRAALGDGQAVLAVPEEVVLHLVHQDGRVNLDFLGAHSTALSFGFSPSAVCCFNTNWRTAAS